MSSSIAANRLLARARAWRVPLALALWQGLWAAWYHRLGAGFAGLRTFAPSLWQLLPAAWLQGRAAWASLAALHGQPPLFNALYALFLNLPLPLAAREALLAGLYQALAWHTLVLLYGILRRLDLRAGPALVWTLLWSLYPAFAGAAYVFSYTLWVIWLMAALVRAALEPGLRGHRALWGVALALALLRAAYGLPFLLALLVWDGLRHRFTRAPRSRAWALTLALVGLWTLKNGLLFGVWTSSSWFGMNWARNYLAPFNRATLEQDVAAGRLPDIVQHRPFEPIDAYPRRYWAAAAQDCAGPPASCAARRPDGEANFNFIGYIPVSAAFADAGVRVWAAYPGRMRYFVRRMVLNLYFTPAYYATSAPSALLHWWEPWTQRVDAWLCPGVTFDGPGRPPLSWQRYTCPRLAGLHLAVVALTGATLLWAWFRREAQAGPRTAAFWARALALGVWSYGTVVYNLFEFGENPRFRLEIDILTWVLLAALLAHAAAMVRRGLRRLPG